MKRTSPDLTGKTFGRLVVQERAAAGGKPRWICACKCGATRTVYASNLTGGLTSSCGCIRKEQLRQRSTTHGKSNTAEFNIWTGMRERCTNPNNPAFNNYGGRGISVCDRWLNSFAAFYEDMGSRPSWEHSIDRYPDNDGNYEPSNCRWATRTEQNRNARSNVAAMIDGERVLMTDASRRLGMTESSIADRIARGWPIERAFTEPKNA